MTWAIKTSVRFRYWLCLLAGVALLWGCLTQQEPASFNIPEQFVDSLSGYDSVQIILKDTSGKQLDVLFQGKVHSAGQLQNLPAPHAIDGEMIVTLIGYQDGKVAYQVDRLFNPKTNQVETHRPLILPISRVSFTVQDLRLPVKTKVTLPEVTIEPPGLFDKSLSWTSSDSKVLLIEENMLRALSKGTVTLRVALKVDTSKYEDLVVVVTANPKAPDSLNITPDTLNVAARGRVGQFALQAFPNTASEVFWSNADTSVATLTESGQVQGIKKGYARIKAVSKEDESVQDSAVVAVSDPIPVERVRFLMDSVELFIGGAADSLKVEVTPMAANPQVAFSMRDSALASVLKGRILGLKEGRTWVVVKSLENPFWSDSLRVIVHPAQKVDSVGVLPDTLKLYVGGERKPLQAKVYPLALPPLIQWRSAFPTIASVDGRGIVSPLSEGKTFVTATSKADSGKKAISLVLVKRDVPILDVGRDTTIPLGGTITFTPKVTQEYGTVTRFKWDLNGDGAWDDSSADLKSVTYKYDQEKEVAVGFYVRDAEGNDTSVVKRVKAVIGPVINIFSPLNNFYSNQSPIAVAWSVDGRDQEVFLKEALKEGANTVTRKAKDGLGNIYSASITVYYDTTAPIKPIVKGPAIAGSSTPTWTWTSGDKEGSGVYRLSLDKDEFTGVSETKDTSYVSNIALKEDLHTLFVQERDAAGNWSLSGKFVISVDVSGPGKPVVKVSPASVTNIRTPVWSWASGGGGTGSFQYKLNNGDLKIGGTVTTETFYTPAKLTPGAHTLYVQEKDSVGNWSLTGSSQVFIDTVVPNAPLVTMATVSPTNNRQPMWTWTSGGNGGRGLFRFRLDNSDLTQSAKESVAMLYKPNSELAEGMHTLYVQEQDSAGNWSLTAEKLIRIDLTPPNIPVVTSIELHTMNLRPTWSWSSSGGGSGAYRFKLGDSAMKAGAISTSEKKYTPSTDLDIGLGNTLYVQEQDSAGNWSGTGMLTLKTHGQTGYTVGSNIFQTKDGGLTWDSSSSGLDQFSSAGFVSVYFADVQTGFAIDYHGMVARTKNGGLSWDTNTIATPGFFKTSLTSVCFPNANTGYVLNGFGKIGKTSNSGSSWTFFLISPFLFSLNFTDSETGYAVGNEGAVFKTVNGGSHWDSLPRVTSQLLYNVHFLNATTGYACGSTGAIIKTTDRGNTWADLSSGTGQSLYSIFFPGPETGFAVGTNGTIIKTINGGATWKALASGTDITLKSVFFTNLNVGYAVGGDGKVLLTRDGGVSWISRSIGTQTELMSIFFP